MSLNGVGSRQYLYRRGVSLIALLALLSAVDGSQPSLARHRRRDDDAEAVQGKAKAEKAPTGPMYAVVSLADQHVSFYEGSHLWARSTISTGVNGHPTPTGIFNILEKERYHHSNIYSGAPMPFMQRVTWTGIALHQGVVTGRPASHGCVRLPADFAKRLFSATKVGQRVIISPQEIAPVDIAHAHLPVPMLQAAPGEQPDTKGIAAKPTAGESEPVALKNAPAGSNLLNPIAYAQAMKSDAAVKASAATKTKDAAEELLESKEQEQRSADRALNGAEAASREAQRDLDAANRNASTAQGDEAVRKAADKKAAAELKFAQAQDSLRQARDAKASKDAEIQAAQTAIRDAEIASQTAATNLKQATRRLEPVSIFISRKTGRIYVRQGFQSLFDVPVTIREPERPLGTHLFVASESGEDNASLRWVALTTPAAVEVKARPHSGRRGRKIEPVEDEPAIAPFPETASAALDRIEIPADVAPRISELLWTGATLIISDVSMSGEGRFAMDFQILSRTRIRAE